MYLPCSETNSTLHTSFSKTDPHRWLDIFTMLRKDCSLADLHLLVEVFQEHRARSAGYGFRRQVSRVIRVMGSGARSAGFRFQAPGQGSGLTGRATFKSLGFRI